MPLYVSLGKDKWEDDLRYQCQRYQNILIQPSRGDDADKLMGKAEVILKDEKFVRCDDRSEKFWHNDLVSYQKEYTTTAAPALATVTSQCA